ncbi:hypothetical protein QYE76_008079 [Lolium multiflorum]|uniref:Transposase (putative) gypsy type domain-containing protein n=1 Tax=Lolium multiflorum TaxID=4521 RepID=A0AAD8UZ79_LOLMU|nr:hypothetical protein QYE76_008079 [Lolium multiflorum]
MAAADLGAVEWERSKVTNQDVNLLKRLGLMKKEDAIRFPSEESYPNPPMEYRVSFVDHLIRGLSTPIHDFLRGLLFVYGIQLHQLTPNSILHISIFITLCECFLGITPNWILWKRIFCLRRNGSHSTTYNIGGVVICVRTDVDYFDVKFPDSVQGWRRRWLYIHEEDANSVEHNIVPFDGNAKIQRRHSWDAEASEEEKGEEAPMTRIHELRTRGKELSGVQTLPTFFGLEYSLFSAKIPFGLMLNHPTMTSLPPLPEDGEVEEQAIVAEDNQGSSLHESEVAGSHMKKKLNLHESTQSLPPAVSPKNKRKRDDAEASSTSKPEEAVPSHPKSAMIHTSRLSSFPMIKDLLRIGAQFVGYREYANKTEEKLAEANERANTLAQQLEHSEKARKKAELDATEARAEADKAKADAAGVEDLRKRLHTAETSLSDHIAAQSAREEAILKRLRTQSRRFVEELKELRVQLQSVKKQSLMLMEQSRESSQREKIALQQAQDAITERTAVAEAAAATSRENSMLQLLIDASLDMAGIWLVNPCLLVFDSVCSSFYYFCDDDFVSSFIECIDIILQSFSRSFFVIFCDSWRIVLYFYRQDCFSSMDQKNGVSCVAVFGVVRILHNTLVTPPAKYA